MKGFIVDETYRIEADATRVYLFGRLENGESFCTISRFVPYFAIRKEDAAKARALSSQAKFAIEDVEWRTMRGESAARIVVTTPKDVPPLRKLFEEHKIACLEADIRFTQRFLIDHGIKRVVDIEGAFEKDAFVDRVYREPALSPAGDWYPQLRTLSFDIETSMDGRRLYSISLSCRGKGCEKDEVLIVRKKGELRHAINFPDEKSMLAHFMQAVVGLDPDIITGWNAIDFDLAFLRRKCTEHGVPFRFARRDWECQLRIESSFFKDSTAEVPGRQVLDGIALLKMNFIALDNYKLATAARELLGQDKLIGETDKGKQIEDAYRDDTQRFVDYNLKDAQLVLDIIEKTNAIGITMSRSLLTGMSLERVRGSVASFDSLYLRELRALGYVAPSSQYAEKDESISGGYVLASKPGIYDYIVVCDFKSLYPSLMRTFNIDPLAYEQGKLGEGKAIEAPNGARFSAEQGILPRLLERLWAERDEAKRKKDKRTSFAIKILMNSLFGVLANPACRFFSLEMGNAITSFGRQFIKLAITRIEEMGHEVIYGDTDSIFINSGMESLEQAQRMGEEIARAINAFYAEHIRQQYGCESHMELQMDKVFVRFIMPKVRGSEQGAKKRYAGIVLVDGKEELVATGLEIVRRDWTELAKGFQDRLLRMVFAKENPEQFIKDVVRDLRAGRLDEQVVYQKAVRKDLEEYTKTTPPHVKAARMLEERGIALGSNIIEYVMTTEGPYPVELREGKSSPPIDYEHYIEKQLRPIADAVLGFYGTSFDDLLKGSKQTTLGGF